MSGETILVIDDSTEMVKHLTEYILPTFDYRTISASDGQSGLALIREHQPDLVMLDYNLPRMTGIDVLQQMAQESLSVPVILMTGYGSELSAIEAFRLGAKDYLIKPFTVDEVVETVSRALIEKRLLHDKEAFAEESRRLRVEIARLVREMRTMSDFGKAVTSLLSAEKIMRKAADAALKLTEAERCVIWLPDGDDGLMRAYIQEGEGKLRLHRTEVAVEGSFIEMVMQTEDPFRRSDLEGDGLELFDACRARAVLCVPLRLRGKALGALGVMNKTAVRRFSKRHELLISFLGDYTAIALENARVLEIADSALAVKIDKLNTLMEITHAITSSVDLDEVARLTIHQVHTHWDIEASSLWLVNEECRCLTVLASVGTAVEQLMQVSIPLGLGFVGRVVETGEAIWSNDVVNDDRHYQKIDDDTGFQTHSIVCVPLVTQGRTVGAMQLINNRMGDFFESDVEWATSIATAVAIAVTNALSFSR